MRGRGARGDFAQIFFPVRRERGVVRKVSREVGAVTPFQQSKFQDQVRPEHGPRPGPPKYMLQVTQAKVSRGQYKLKQAKRCLSRNGGAASRRTPRRAKKNRQAHGQALAVPSASGRYKNLSVPPFCVPPWRVASRHTVRPWNPGVVPGTHAPHGLESEGCGAGHKGHLCRITRGDVGMHILHTGVVEGRPETELCGPHGAN